MDSVRGMAPFSSRVAAAFWKKVLLICTELGNLRLSTWEMYFFISICWLSLSMSSLYPVDNWFKYILEKISTSKSKIRQRNKRKRPFRKIVRKNLGNMDSSSSIFIPTALSMGITQRKNVCVQWNDGTHASALAFVPTAPKTAVTPWTSQAPSLPAGTHHPFTWAIAAKLHSILIYTPEAMKTRRHTAFITYAEHAQRKVDWRLEDPMLINFGKRGQFKESGFDSIFKSSLLIKNWFLNRTQGNPSLVSFLTCPGLCLMFVCCSLGNLVLFPFFTPSPIKACFQKRTREHSFTQQHQIHGSPLSKSFSLSVLLKLISNLYCILTGF